MEKINVSLDGKADDDSEIFEGFTDNSFPEPHIALEKDEVINFLASTPYNYRFITEGGIPVLRVYKGVRYEDIPSTPIPTDHDDILEGYYMDGYGFADIE